jgi:tetratricopeptide (TPR) repeat protein
MLKKYIGKNRAENLDWLLNVWLKEGPPVCFLQGFSGVGKTDLARDFRELAEKQGKWQHAVINEIADRATPSVLESLMELSVALSQQGLAEMETVLFEQTNPNLGYAVERALQRPVVIILDEAQRFFRADSGTPLPEMNGILAFLRNRPTLQGRLLLLSDRIVEEARWSEWIPKRTLTELEPDEAIEALETKLKGADISVEIPPEQKKEVVRVLDFNPRAIEALVGALRYDTLDEIIGSNPGLWAVRDREVSRDFLRALERDLLERTMRHLDESHQRKLWRLAVHRRSFKREALERLCGTKDKATQLRSILVTRFLLNFYKGALALNPIVREISLSHLRDEPAEFREAHSAAADYHLRHFKAKQMVGTHSKLGESFAELRYHLVQAGRQDELRDIGHRFTDHLKLEIKSVTPVPTDREELDERIGVLTVLLGNEGAKGLEYHLARCLQARAKPGDMQQAVIHAERALGPGAPEASWYLLANLKRQAEGADAAVAVIRRGLRAMSDPDVAAPLYQLGAEILAKAGKTDEAVALLKDGIKIIPPDENLYSLYQLGAEILAKAGQTDEAVALLKDGIKVIPPDQSLFSLYHSCGDLLARAGKTDEAVALLKDGIKVISPDQNLFSLYQICGDLLARAGKTDEAVALLKDGIKIIPPDQSLYSLYHSCGDLLARAGKTDEAVALLKDGIKVIPPDQSLFSLYHSCGDLLARAGKTDEAVALLKDGIKVIPPDKNLFSLYQLAAEILAKAGKTDEAVALLKDGIKVISPDQSLFSLYQICGDLLARAGKTDEAVALLKDGIKVIPPDKNLFSLYQMLGEVFCRAAKLADAIAAMREGLRRIPEQFNRYKLAEGVLYLCAASGDATTLAEILSMTGSEAVSRQQAALGSVLQRQAQGRWREAAEAASTARREFPSYLALAAVEAFSRLAAGDADAAWQALASFPNLTFGPGEPHRWLAAFIHLRRGARSEASAALAQYLGRQVDESCDLNESFLLRLWDQQEAGPENSRLCFHFPMMPASLTGLNRPVRRIQFAKPVLPADVTRDAVGSTPPVPSASQAATPEIYVSYAWGEDSTETGRQREEIVNQLCAAVERSGRIIGRDKDRIRSGESIERFAHEISKAKRIVAVITEKSLNSEFCMAHELFRAFRRCDYQRAEFQERVIALIMDDAKPLLRDNLAVVALAKAWQQRLEKLRTELQSVDPTRKSSDLWVFVDMMEDMCPRLPTMLGALKDIVMKRGFDDIVRDGFQEVISRLPPPAGK